MIAIIAQNQKMFENELSLPKDRLTTHFTGDCIRQLQRIVNRKIERGISLETVQKRQGTPNYFLKITGDPYFNNRLTPWALNAPEEYREPEYTWLLNNTTGIGDYVWKEETA